MKKQEIEGCKYYNYAAIPTTAPHEKPNMKPLEDGSIWKMAGGKPLFARYCTDWDCKEETEWWYVIKDNPFDINKLKSKRRYEINKGIKNFSVEKIEPKKYANDICKIAFDVWKTYPAYYRPNITEQDYLNEIEHWCDVIVYGAFYRENSELCGYAILKNNESYLSFIQLKTLTEYEKYGINFAIINQILEDYKLSEKFYISDGTRNILHETKFQDFLIKYFGFRKAYCKLNIVYNLPIKFLVKILKPFRKIATNFGSIGKKINSVFFMDEIAESCKRCNNDE